jgi:GrpB-like predicted nucleotidyltransferase (UPF0157 family)
VNTRRPRGPSARRAAARDLARGGGENALIGLRASPALRDEYGRRKRALAVRFADDREAYSDAKSAFIRRVESDLADGV